MASGREDGGNAAGLDRLVDDLAMHFVLEGGGGAEWLAPVRETLEKIGGEAARAGREPVERLAAELAALAQALGTGGGDVEAVRREMEAGIGKLQAALAEAPAPATPTAAGSLAQEPELVNDFLVEARDHLANIENRVLVLEQSPGDMDALHAIFRGFHTIKGLAGFLEFDAIREVSHEIETVLDQARNGQLAITADVIDVVLAAADFLAHWLDRIQAGTSGAGGDGAGEEEPARESLVARVRALAPCEGPATVEAAPEALAAPPPAAGDGARRKKKDEGASAGETDGRLVKVDTAKLDALVDMAGELVIAQSLVRHDPGLAALKNTRLTRNLAQLGRITNDLQKTAMAMRMVPISQLFRKMARLVRDLSRKSGKPAELATSGEDTELDRHIVEALADPLMHMIRNSVDHGIEEPAARAAAGKPAVAEVRLRAAHQSGHIVIEVGDDGRGLNREKILRKGVERGLVADAAAMSDADIHNLIFQPGFSTADQVSDVSGRGVGMDVVRKQIQKLRGRIEIRTEEGRGTTFQFKLPLTLAIIDGLVLGVGVERYILPIFVVKEMLRPTADMVFTVENRDEMVLVRGRLLPIVRLHRLFGVQPRSEDPAGALLAVAESGDHTFCLMVDDLIGKQEVVIKSLGETLKNLRGIAGGAILGDGRVGLILDIETIFGEPPHGGV